MNEPDQVLMTEPETPGLPMREMPLDSSRPMVRRPQDLPPRIQLPSIKLKPIKTNQVAPVEIYDQTKLHSPTKTLATEQTEYVPRVHSKENIDPRKKKSNSKGVLDNASSLRRIDAIPHDRENEVMRDPSDWAMERSKNFNIFFGLFFASGGLYYGYAVAVLGPLGEKWLKFNFGITDKAAVFLGMANLG
jgi:hypothetical protein